MSKPIRVVIKNPALVSYEFRAKVPRGNAFVVVLLGSFVDVLTVHPLMTDVMVMNRMAYISIKSTFIGTLSG